MKCIIGSVALAALIATAAAAQSPNKAKGVEKSKRSLPTVEIEFQGDSPIKLLGSTKSVNGVRELVELAITIENVSDKAIRAYAMRVWMSRDEPSQSCFQLNIMKPGKVLQPTQSEVRSTWRPYSRGPGKVIHLSVDFVEFTDSSTWGMDSCDTAQKLAGARAGARTLVGRLQKILEESGPGAVLKSLEAEIAEISIPLEQSPVWQSAFQSALQEMAHRIRQAATEGGILKSAPSSSNTMTHQDMRLR